MHKDQKTQIVEELTERLRETDALIVADYRGLTNANLAGLRATLRGHGATFSVVKNTLTRRAAEAAGADALLALLEGPTAIAFVRAEGDPVAVAKALADAARETKILTLRGGVMSGRTISAGDVDELAKLPPADVLKGQVVGAIVAPLTQLAGLLNAPLSDLVGLLDARVAQLEEQGGAAAAPEAAVEAPAAEEPAADAEPAAEEPAAEEPAAEAEPAAEEPAAEEPAAQEPAAEAADVPQETDG